MCTTCSECVADMYVGVKTHLSNIHTRPCTSTHNTCKVHVTLTAKNVVFRVRVLPARFILGHVFVDGPNECRSNILTRYFVTFQSIQYHLRVVAVLPASSFRISSC